MLSSLRAFVRHALGFRPRDDTVFIRCNHCDTLNLAPADAHLLRCWSCRALTDGPREMLVEFEAAV